MGSCVSVQGPSMCGCGLVNASCSSGSEKLQDSWNKKVMGNRLCTVPGSQARHVRNRCVAQVRNTSWLQFLPEIWHCLLLKTDEYAKFMFSFCFFSPCLFELPLEYGTYVFNISSGHSQDILGEI